jgi:hypothetical protein
MLRKTRRKGGLSRSLFQKASVNLAMMDAGGGLLPTELARRFVDLTIDYSKLLQMLTVIGLKSPKQRVNSLDMPNRVMQPGDEGVALAAGDRATPTFDNVEHDAKTYKGELELTDEVLEDNIEGDAFEDTIMRALTKAWARDTEEVVIRSDTASSDRLYAKSNGLLKKATSNTVDALGGKVDRLVLRDTLATMPEPYRRDTSDLTYLTSANGVLAYRESLANRNTSLGDVAIGAVGGALQRVGYAGIPLTPVPLMPENTGVGSNRTQILLCRPKNAEVGIWRKIKMRRGEDIRKGTIFVVIRVRMDVVWQHEDSVVKAHNIDPTMPAVA